MFAELRQRVSRISPRVAIAGLLIAVAAGSGVALLLMRGGETVDADDAVQPMAARIDRVDGSVGIARVIDENTEPDWDDAAINTPVSVGDRIYTRDNSRASVALTGRNFVRLDPGASLDVLALDDQRTQLALRSGSAIFDVGALEPNDFYEVATPFGAVDFTEPGLYQVGIDDDTALISVLSGLAQVVGASGSGYINKGEVYTLVGTAASEVVASTLAPTLAGGIVDDYYRYRHPSEYDGRYQSYDTYVSDPFYYDPYRSSASYRYVSADIPGLHDLDDYGDWTDIDGYGHCWAPRVRSGWAPFRSGFWDLNGVWGPSWVSHEPWGWAPYHYGRWTFAQQRWFWVPVEVRSRRSYCPATVAFIPLAQDQIGWVPLAPGEQYVPRYYDSDFRPRYLASREVVRDLRVQRTFVNLNEPSAITVVPVRALRHRIEPSQIAQADQQAIRRSKHTLDPFEVEGVRELAIRNRDERRNMRRARTEPQAVNRPVLTTRTPASLPADRNLAKALRLEPVSGELRKKRLKVNQTGQVITDRRADGLPRAMAPNQVRNGKDREQRSNPATAPAAQQRVQQEQLRQQMREQLKAERQQQSGAASQDEAERRAQQKRLERKPPDAPNQQQQQRVQQQQQQRVQQQQQMQNQQRKQERRKPPEASVQQQQQQQMQNQQRKQERRKPPEASVPQQQQQRVQQQQQQQMQNQQRKQEKPPQRKPPEASVRQQPRTDQGLQIREQARVRRAQQEAVRQQGQARQQQQRVMIEQRNRVASRESQAREQFNARAQQQQRQAVIRDQAARSQASQGRTAPERPQGYLGPPIREPNPAQVQPRVEKGKRRPSQ